MDLAKSILVFGAIALVTATVINRYETAKYEQREKSKLILRSIERDADELNAAVRTYFGDAYDAYLEHKEKGGDYPRDDKPPNVMKYEDNSFGVFSRSLAVIERKYPAFAKRISDLRDENKKMHKAYRNLEGWEVFSESRSGAREIALEIVGALYDLQESCWSAFLSNPEGSIKPTDCGGS